MEHLNKLIIILDFRDIMQTIRQKKTILGKKGDNRLSHNAAEQKSKLVCPT